jgi:hypothetical protein
MEEPPFDPASFADELTLWPGPGRAYFEALAAVMSEPLSANIDGQNVPGAGVDRGF